jgi:hypothetical protein
VYPRIGGRRDRASSRRASSVSDSLSTCVREALINPSFAQVSESSSMSVQDAHACLPGILATVRSRMTLLQHLFAALARFRLTADATSPPPQSAISQAHAIAPSPKANTCIQLLSPNSPRTTARPKGNIRCFDSHYHVMAPRGIE